MTTSNCMTCIYGGSWCGEISTEPGHCYMFKDEPDGVCGQWRTSITQPPAGERAELVTALLQCLAGPAALTTREATAIKDAADMLEADVSLINEGNKAQQVAVPMTEAQIFACDPVPHVMFDQQRIDFARAIEAFHGIGAKP
jgi:hypothetical protein